MLSIFYILWLLLAEGPGPCEEIYDVLKISFIPAPFYLIVIGDM